MPSERPSADAAAADETASTDETTSTDDTTPADDTAADADRLRVTVLGDEIDLDATRLGDDPARVRRQVREYERGERRAFDLQVAYPAGFRGRAMRAVAAVPYGETRTYGDVADALDTAPVAVGQACANNPLPLVVPCHRVVAADGSLRGYSAAGGVATKRRLLAHERAHDDGAGGGDRPGEEPREAEGA